MWGLEWERAHGCLCKEKAMQELRPYHKMVLWLELLAERFGAGDKDISNLPLFPTGNGSHPSKEETVKGIRNVLAKGGVALTRTVGGGREMQRYGEHALRVYSSPDEEWSFSSFNYMPDGVRGQYCDTSKTPP